MAPVPARASAHHPQIISLPPRQHLMVLPAMCAVFVAGITIGIAMGQSPPPTVERCVGAPDPIGCLIRTLD